MVSSWFNTGNVDVATGTESKILVRVGRFTIAFRHALPIGNRYRHNASIADQLRHQCNVYPGGIAISADRITKPTAFIFFAPAQAAAAVSLFRALLTYCLSRRHSFRNRWTAATSSPGGAATGGTQNNRTRINALFADLHAETMDWATFTSNTANPPSDPDGYLRWNPSS